MKIYDQIRLIRDKKRYLENDVHKGDIGYIIEDELGDCLLTQFFNDDMSDSVIMTVMAEDVEVVED